ncbi:hypothetical protein K432DRAFT_425818 [Lepidopterella palustris CBS 459.81]|uniref:Uncharacterized protein n=1 Tax=Lepidopterella palustris CBS 459.81 TaxID=1314670 RepID=A0A8E2EAW5_9PEZI|nr:hypothetical protein K432DRAFT_425818 [Lepidopterella palustris CBS 459.81]
MSSRKRHAASDYFNDRPKEKKSRTTASSQYDFDKYVSPRSPTTASRDPTSRRSSESGRSNYTDRYASSHPRIRDSNRAESMDRRSLYRPPSVPSSRRESDAGSWVNSPQSARTPPSEMLPPEPVLSLRGGSLIDGRSQSSPLSLNTGGASPSVLRRTGSGSSTPKVPAPVASMIPAATPLTPSSTASTNDPMALAEQLKEAFLMIAKATTAETEWSRAQSQLQARKKEIQEGARWFSRYPSLKEQKENSRAKAEKVFKDRDNIYKQASNAGALESLAAVASVFLNARGLAPANDEQLTQLKERLQTKENEITALQNQNAQIVAQNAQFMAELSSIKLIVGQTTPVSNEIASMKTDLDSLKGMVWDSLNSLEEGVRKDLQIMKSTFGQVAHIQPMKASLNFVQKEVDLLQRRMDSNNNNRDDSVRDKIKSLEESQKKFEGMQSTNCDCKPKLEAMEATMEKLQTELNKLKSQEKNTTKADIAKVRSDTEAAIADIKAFYATLLQRVDHLSVKQEELKKESYSEDERRTMLEAVVSNEENSKAIRMLNSRSDEHESHFTRRCDVLEQKLGSSSDTVKALEKRVESIEKKTNSDSNDPLKTLETRMSLVEARSRNASARLSTPPTNGNTDERVVTVSRMEKAESEIVDLKRECEDLNNLPSLWDVRVGQLDARVDETLTEIQNCTTRQNNLATQLKELTEQQQSMAATLVVLQQSQQQQSRPPVSAYNVPPNHVLPSQTAQNGVSPSSSAEFQKLRQDYVVSFNRVGTIENAMRGLEQQCRDIALQVNACIAGLQSLENRYDNLTTDDLARNMVNQMQAMYPQAGNIQAEFDRSRQVVGILTDRVAKTENRCDLLSETVAQVQRSEKKVDKALADIINLQTAIHNVQEAAQKADEKAGSLDVDLDRLREETNSHAAALLSYQEAATARVEEQRRSMTQVEERLDQKIDGVSDRTLQIEKQMHGKLDDIVHLQLAVETVNSKHSNPAILESWDPRQR